MGFLKNLSPALLLCGNNLPLTDRPLTIRRVKRSALRIFNKDEYLLISPTVKPYRHQYLYNVKFFQYNTLGFTDPPPYLSRSAAVPHP